MGMAVNSGMSGISGMSGMSAGFTAQISSAGSVSSQLAMMKKNKQKNQLPKKKLNYNPRDIANQLQRASKSRNAAMVLTRARSKVAALQSAKVSGKYKDSEVRIALAHARRMVRCTRLKVNNLKEEESLKSRNDRTDSTSEQEKRREVKRRVRQKEQDLKVKVAIEQSQQVLRERMRRQQLNQKRRMHRSEEQSKIIEADMKYLQGLDDHDRPAHNIDMGNAALELSLAAERLAELQRMEQQMEHQVEQQVEAEVEMEMGSMDMGGFDMAVTDATALSQTASADAAASQGAAVDVVV